MEVKYLIDTNIFLEILLGQEKSEFCKTFLNQRLGQICTSDFSLHSIGVILFRNKKFELYNSFFNDVLPKVKIVTLQPDEYKRVADIARQFSLDFDDSYQVAIAESLNLSIMTMDSDFNKVSHFCKINFIG